jgi:hypothetical protein
MKKAKNRHQTHCLKNIFSIYHHLLFKLLLPQPSWLLFTLDFIYHLGYLFKLSLAHSWILLPILHPGSTTILSPSLETIS